MSGYKHSLITMDEADYRRLHEAEMERLFKAIRQLEAQSSESKLSSDLQAQLDQLKARQEKFSGLADYLQDQACQIELEIDQELNASRVEFYEHLSNLYQQVWGDYDRLSEVVNTVGEHSRLENQKLARRQKKLGQQLHQFVQDRAEKSALAAAWFNSTLALDDFIRRNYDHEHFFPGLLEKVYEKISMAQYNLEHGMDEAALSVSQDTYLQLSGLRQSLEQKTMEFESLFTLIHRAAENLSVLMSANAECTALDLEGNQIGYSINLNYWSSGRFDKLLARLKAWMQNIISKKSIIPFAQLQEIFLNEMPHFQHEFESIIFDARLAAINSQLRTNIAEIAILALQRQGYVNHAVNFEANDQRGNLLVSLGNFDGSQVSLQVNAVDDQKIKNDLIFEAADAHEKTEHELRLQYEEIRNSLLRFGLKVGPMETNRAEPRRQRLLQVPQTPAIQKSAY